MKDGVAIKKCRCCGQEYKSIRNPNYGIDKYAMRFINEDDKNSYRSNKSPRFCPTCVVKGIR